MIPHALFFVLFVCPISAQFGSWPGRRDAVSRISRPLSRFLRRRGLVKRSQCILGRPKNAQPAYVVTTEITTVRNGGGNADIVTTTLTSSGSASSGRVSPSGAYKLKTEASGDNFFDHFTFFTSPDPTNGFVTYVDQSKAQSAKLIGMLGDAVFLRGDNTSQLSSAGLRNSVRVISKDTFTVNSLLVLDAVHIPSGCGFWPAFWLLGIGAEWPHAGEMDIVEGVNLAKRNQYTLHSDKGCKLAQPMQGSGKVLNTDCDATANGNSACGIQDPSDKSFGEGFNTNGGGVFAALWTDDAVSMWFWEANSVPSDVTSKTPQPGKWGKPTAQWADSACDLQKFYQEQQFIINLTFCGDWAGKDEIFAQSGCPGTCADVMADPSNFDNAYWLINSIRLYQA